MINAKECVNFFKKIRDAELAHYASSLSFHTILALIPILLITFSVFTKMPSFQEHYEKVQAFIFNSLIPNQQETMIEYLNQFMQNTGNMGTVGLVFVLYISVMFFLDYEKIVSKIFETTPRNFWQAFSIYWTMLTVMPLGLVVSFYVSNTVQTILASTQVTNSINLLLFSPYLVIWLMHFIMYTISVRVKIYLKSALISSFIASLVWFTSKTLFVYYVAHNKTYLSIYGSFSILLFFFLWIYFSWLIYLYGLKLCFLLNVHERTKRQKEAQQSDIPKTDS